ncbi:MAG: TM0106 family RecB-like putative nuclease, partial [Actinomycetes bacterium]
MQLIDGNLIWSASDLTAASVCEYGVLRTLDVKLGRASKSASANDPLMTRIAELGDKHEQNILAELKTGAGSDALLVVELPHLRGSHTVEALTILNANTMDAFASQPDVVFQAGFFDGEFFGYADFIERTDQGWRVCDAKLARQARPKALLQLAAYADQLRQAGLHLAPVAALLLGNGKKEEFRLVDVLPVFKERRARLRAILNEHHSESAAIGWGDERYIACGKCPDCAEAIDQTQDLLLVAGLRMDQRRKFREQGLHTVADLAKATEHPTGMAQGTFDKLTAQARLQVKQLDAGQDADGYPNEVFFELTDFSAVTLATLPAPSPGDIFFDFEGDPMYNEGNPETWGLEYLWGVMEAPVDGAEAGVFRPWWADDSDQERNAFRDFMEYVAERRQAHPDMHIYHYAPYEKTALLRLA